MCSSGQRSQILLLVSAGATNPAWWFQVPVPWSLLAQLLCSHPRIPSALGISRASCVPSFWCCCRLGWAHSPSLLSSDVYPPTLCQADYHHQFVSLDLEVPQGLDQLFLHHIWRCLSSWPWNLQSIVSTDVPEFYTCYLVVVLHVCFACQHLTSCCDVLYCFRGLFLHLRSYLLW